MKCMGPAAGFGSCSKPIARGREHCGAGWMQSTGVEGMQRALWGQGVCIVRIAAACVMRHTGRRAWQERMAPCQLMHQAVWVECRVKLLILAMLPRQ